MFVILLLLAIVGPINSVIVRDNVIFRKVSDVTTTRSKWTVTLVIDLKPYSDFLSQSAFLYSVPRAHVDRDREAAVVNSLSRKALFRDK